MNSYRLPGLTPPAKDVRALFEKASIENMRYLTFGEPKAPERIVGDSVPANAAEATEALPTTNNGNQRRPLNSIFEANARLRIASPRRGFTGGSGAALAFASYAGGVGKTTLCATVARVLSSRLSSVLVADRCSEGIIPYYFSLERQNACGLQTVFPNTRRAGYPITLFAAPRNEQLDAPTLAWLERLQTESSLTLTDLPTLNGRSTEDELNQAGQLIVPLVPDVQSIASIARIEELSGMLGKSTPVRNLFVLNRFDGTRTLHREIRAHLEKTLKDRLAPVAVRESESVAEALSLGMTVIDHVPQSSVVKDFEELAMWLEVRLSNAVESSTEKAEIA